MALVKLPSSSPLALQPWWGRRGGCCLWFSVFFFFFFFLNSIWNQKAVDSGKWSSCPSPTLIWSDPLFPP